MFVVKSWVLHSPALSTILPPCMPAKTFRLGAPGRTVHPEARSYCIRSTADPRVAFTDTKYIAPCMVSSAERANRTTNSGAGAGRPAVSLPERAFAVILGSCHTLRRLIALLFRQQMSTAWDTLALSRGCYMSELWALRHGTLWPDQVLSEVKQKHFTRPHPPKDDQI